MFEVIKAALLNKYIKTEHRGGKWKHKNTIYGCWIINQKWKNLEWSFETQNTRVIQKIGNIWYLYSSKRNKVFWKYFAQNIIRSPNNSKSWRYYKNYR